MIDYPLDAAFSLFFAGFLFIGLGSWGLLKDDKNNEDRKRLQISDSLKKTGEMPTKFSCNSQHPIFFEAFFCISMSEMSPVYTGWL